MGKWGLKMGKWTKNGKVENNSHLEKLNKKADISISLLVNF